MKNIKFTSGTMAKLCDTYYEVRLYNKDGKQVYAATVDMGDAASIINNHINIKMI